MLVISLCGFHMENSLLISVHGLLIARMGNLWCIRNYFHEVLLYLFRVSVGTVIPRMY